MPTNPNPPSIDLGDSDASGVINGAIFETLGSSGSGSGSLHAFLRIHDQIAEDGFNTDLTPPPLDDVSGIHTRSLLLGSVPTVTIDGVVYREFLLDIAEGGSGSTVSLDSLQIYVGGISLATLATMDRPLQQDGTPSSGVAGGTLVYDLDAGGDRWVKLTDPGGGNGQANFRVLVPETAFSAAGATATSQVVLYSAFGYQGGAERADSSFEEWAVGTVVVTPPPGQEPPPSIVVDKLVSLDGLTFTNTVKVVEGSSTLVTYQVTITNTSALTDPVTLTSILDDHVADDPALLAAAIAANGGSNVLASGAHLTFTYQTTITPNAVNGDIVNEVLASGHDDDTPVPALVSAEDTATVLVTNLAPIVTLLKEVSLTGQDDDWHDSVAIDEGSATPVYYRLTIHNGSNSADPVTVDSLIDDHANAAILALLAPHVGETIAPGHDLVIQYGASLNQNAVDGSVVNTATASGEDDEGLGTGALEDSATVTVTNLAPVVTLVKEVSLTGADGDWHDSVAIDEGSATPVYYRLTIHNGSNSADPVTVDSLIDDHANAAILALLAPHVGETIAPGHDLVIQYGASLNQNAVDGSVVNTATAAGHDDENSVAGPVSDDATVEVQNLAPIVTLVKDVSLTGNVGDWHDDVQIDEGTATQVYYRVTIHNGSNSADPVTVASLIDDHATLLGNPAAYAALQAHLNEVIAPGSDLVITYAATLNQNALNGSVVNTATASGYDDENTGTGSVADNATVKVADLLPKITIDKQVDADADGVFHNLENVQAWKVNTVVYQYTLTNTSPGKAVDPLSVDLVDDRGTATTADDIHLYVTGTGVHDAGVTLSGDANSNGLLDYGETWTIKWTTTVPALNPSQDWVNVATVYAQDDEQNPVSLSDDAHVQAFAGPGVRTPGFWASSNGQQFWDGVVGNETKHGPNFAAGELTPWNDLNGAASGSGNTTANAFLILNDDGDHVLDTDGTELQVSLKDALTLLNASTKDVQDGRWMLLRDMVATQLNFLAGNPGGDGAADNALNKTDDDPQDLMREAVAWILKTTSNAGGDYILTLSAGKITDGSAVSTSSTQWQNPYSGIEHSAALLHTVLDEYNNTGATTLPGTPSVHTIWANDGDLFV